MSAQQLIELAALKGFGISRKCSNVYRYAQTVDGLFVEQEFLGPWAQFVKFVQAL